MLAWRRMDAEQALADLTEISTQVRTATVVEPSGELAASTVADEARARALADAARRLLAEAERIRPRADRPLAQLEVATGEGSVFIVRDGGRTIVATTGPEPTVGLVFYDLMSCLRSLAAEDPARDGSA